METYKMQIELTDEEFDAMNGVLVAAVMVCLKNEDHDTARFLSQIGLKVCAAKDAAENK